VAGCHIPTFNGGAQVSAPKLDEVVCAHNFSKRKGAEPILQATVAREVRKPILNFTVTRRSTYQLLL
jgi:hypothetical protein